MSTPLRTFFDHGRHTLKIDKLDTHLDVLAFEGHEYLSHRPHFRPGTAYCNGSKNARPTSRQ